MRPTPGAVCVIIFGPGELPVWQTRTIGSAGLNALWPHPFHDLAMGVEEPFVLGCSVSFVFILCFFMNVFMHSFFIASPMGSYLFECLVMSKS